MQINQVSQILQPKVGQTKLSTNNSNDSKAFELILQQMMQSTDSQNAGSTLGVDSNNSINMIDGLNGLNSLSGTNLTSAVNTTDKIGVQNKTASGLDSLSLNPQKLAQMLEIMQASSSNNVMDNFGSDDSSGDDGDSDNGSDSLALGSTPSTDNTGDITQLLQTILQNENTNSGSNTDSNSQIQQLLDSMK
jgi:hypothetical protein